MSDQKNWDAALIKTWRTNANVGDTMKLFTALSGKYVTDCDPPLKRIPPIGLPWYVGVRVFAAAHLPKISTWMFVWTLTDTTFKAECMCTKEATTSSS
jgi:hypothetical protein